MAGVPDPVARSVTVRAPGKVNLALSVGGLREDGYHELQTIFQAVDLYEEVTVRWLGPEEQDVVTVEGRDADKVPLDDSNLAMQALDEMRSYRIAHPIGIHIRKQIPVAGGMAGGSADAAATLVALDALFGLDLPREELLERAARLGADVPFAILGGTAIGTSRGDELTPILTQGRYHWVFATAPHGLSTPSVFFELDRLRGLSPGFTAEHVAAAKVSPSLLMALRTGDPAAVGPLLTNDLERAAVSLAPALADTLAVGREAGALGALVSGSGPTTAFLAADTEGALDIAVALTASGVAADTIRTTGPAHGARVIDRKQD